MLFECFSFFGAIVLLLIGVDFATPDVKKPFSSALHWLYAIERRYYLLIEFKNVSKTYDDGFEAVKSLNFKIDSGEFVVLIGPSGCGKTTTMKMINRLIPHTGGKIFIDGEDIDKLDPVMLRRNIGYVIQQVGLFPHYTIAENVALIPKLKSGNHRK